jgi:hypothetical protein
MFPINSLFFHSFVANFILKIDRGACFFKRYRQGAREGGGKGTPAVGGTSAVSKTAVNSIWQKMRLMSLAKQTIQLFIQITVEHGTECPRVQRDT